MKQLQFFGACGEVTGSSYLLTSEDDTKILVDFGMFQGPKDVENLNYKSLQFNPSEIKGVFLTHAHLDHCGRLPLLIYGGYFGKIYMTAPTRSLIEIIMNDSAKIMKMDMEKKPLYTSDEVEKVLSMVEIVEYDHEVTLGSLSITFKDAGHILGSASILIKDTLAQKSIVFSGDLGNTPEEIVRPTAYIDEADFVVMESTYGDKVHPKEDPTQILMEEIKKVEESGGVLLIPAFSIERTQDILYRLHLLKKEKKILIDTPIFLDSPMAIHATTVFRDFKRFYNEELQKYQDDPFSFEGLVITEDARDSKEIIKAMNPKVIMAGSGMLSGGRIVHHAENYLAQPTTRVLFVGYQAEETLGRQILQGAKSVIINDHQVQVKAQIREIASLSSHADQEKLLTWLGHIKGAKKVFLTHGDTPQRHALRDKVKDTLQIPEVYLPENGDSVSLK